MTLVARITFLILVAATFAAFFVAQRVKSEPPVITVGRITSYISPNGDGLRDGTNVSITIKTADEATVDVVDHRRRPGAAAGRGHPDGRQPAADSCAGTGRETTAGRCVTAPIACASRCATRAARRPCRGR